MTLKSEALPTPTPTATPSWKSTWTQTLFRRPSVATFETLRHETKASSTTAYLWIFVSSSVSITLLVGGLIFCYGWAVNQWDLLWLLLFAIPVASLMSILIFILSTRVTQLMAKALRGTGTYHMLSFSIGAFSAPLALIFSSLAVLVMDASSRFVSSTIAVLLVIPLVFIFGTYGFVLSVIAIKSINQLEWLKAIIISAVGLFTLVVSAIIALVIMIALEYFLEYFGAFQYIIFMLPVIPLCIVGFISAARWSTLRRSVIGDDTSEVQSSLSVDSTLEQRARRARKKWLRADSSSFVDSTSKSLVWPEKKESRLASQLLEFEAWKERFLRSFDNLLKTLSQNQDEVERSMGEDVNRLYAEAAQLLTQKTYDLALEVLETGELQSILVKIDNTFIYILFFPGLHDQPSLLKRYKSFSKGWVSHTEQMCALLPSESQEFALAELALFLTPNLREGTMHLAFQDKQKQILPVGLLDDSEVKNAQGRLCELRQVI